MTHPLVLLVVPGLVVSMQRSVLIAGAPLGGHGPAEGVVGGGGVAPAP